MTRFTADVEVDITKHLSAREIVDLYGDDSLLEHIANDALIYELEAECFTVIDDDGMEDFVVGKSPEYLDKILDALGDEVVLSRIEARAGL